MSNEIVCRFGLPFNPGNILTEPFDPKSFCLVLDSNPELVGVFNLDDNYRSDPVLMTSPESGDISVSVRVVDGSYDIEGVGELGRSNEGFTVMFSTVVDEGRGVTDATHVVDEGPYVSQKEVK